MARVFAAGSSEYVTAPDRAGFDTVDGTLFCWFKTTYAGVGQFMRRDDGGNRNWLLRIGDPATGKVQFLTIFGGNPSVVSSGTYDDGAWHSTLATWSWNGSTTTTIELFVDNSSQGTNTASASCPSLSLPVEIARYSAGGEHLTGDLAECSMWNVVLSADEKTALHKGFSPSLVRPASLIMYVPMIRDVVDLRGATPTTSGGSASTHPRVIYPRRRQAYNVAAAGGGGVFTPYYYREHIARAG